MNIEEGCKSCFDAVALRKIFDDFATVFHKLRTSKRMEKPPKDNNSYEIWIDTEGWDIRMKLWNSVYEAIRDSTAGLKLYNEWKVMKGSVINDFIDGEGI